MRKLVYGINTTLDGNVDHTKGIAGEEVHNYFADLIRQSDTLVYGRKTYDLMVPFWPDMARSDSEQDASVISFAKTFDAVEKIIVFSRTMKHADHNKTEILHGDLEAEIRRLKEQNGKDIMLGGVDLASQVMELGLVDEFHFVVQPVIAGDGVKLFAGKPLVEGLSLKLVGSKVFGNGCVALHYVRESS